MTFESEPEANLDNADDHRSGDRRDALGIIFLFGLFFWIVLVTGVTQLFSWFIDQILQGTVYAWPEWMWTFVTVTQAVLLLVPATLLALMWPGSRYRAIYQSLALAALFILIAAPIRLVKLPAIQTANILQILVSLFVIVCLLLIYWLRHRSLPRFGVTLSSFLALIIAATMAYSWLAWGALGSLLDTILNLGAGLLFGVIIGLVTVFYVYRPLRETSSNQNNNLLLGGFVSSIIVLMMASGYGFGGIQLLLMLILPGLGWVAASLWGNTANDSPENNWLAIAILFGIAVAAPMMLIDPDELRLDTSFDSRDLLIWAFYAALVSMTIAWSFAFITYLSRRRLQKGIQAPVLVGIAFFAWTIALIIYFGFGQPGLYGDRLFVILQDQADLTTIADVPDHDERRRNVYSQLTAHAEASQSDLRSDLEMFGISYSSYYLVNALAVEGGPIVRQWITARHDINRILEIPTLRPLPAASPTSEGSATLSGETPWNLILIGADRVWEDYDVTGEGIIIGQSDTGVDGDHVELASNYRGANGTHDFNWYDPWNQTTEPTDLIGHGTHTLGTVLGKQTGIAPDAEWIGCVNLARNIANPALYLDCLQFMLAPFPLNGDPFSDGDPARSAHILNNSWGCPELEGCDSASLLEAVKALRLAGIFVVAAAGNDGPTCESVRHPLSLYDEVFSVGAIDRYGDLATFSSLGPVTVDGSDRLKPDLVAPGVSILSAYPNGGYEYLPGTSMAGPHVVGTVALIWSANPSLIGNIDKTEEILRTTAGPYQGPLPGCIADPSLPNNAVGFGIVDAFAAVQAALELR